MAVKFKPWDKLNLRFVTNVLNLLLSLEQTQDSQTSSCSLKLLPGEMENAKQAKHAKPAFLQAVVLVASTMGASSLR